MTGVLHTAGRRLIRGFTLTCLAIGIAVATIGANEARADNYSSLVLDAKTGKALYARAPDEARYPASLTKMMTLFLLFEAIETGRVSLSTKMKISAFAAGQAPSKLGLKPGQTITAREAMLALVTKSANDAAVVIAEHLDGTEAEFARTMTSTARELGMSNTTFRNASGLPDPRQVTTARDMATLGRALYDSFPEAYDYFATRSFSYNGRVYANHNRLLGRVPGVNGIKTGYTRASGFNLVTSVQQNNRYVVAVVMGGKTGGSRDAHMVDLIKTHAGKASTGKRTAPLIARNSTGTLTVVASANPPVPAPKSRPEIVEAVATAAPVAVAGLATASLERLLKTEKGEGDADDAADVQDGWKIQIAAVPSESAATDMLNKAKRTVAGPLSSATPFTEATEKGSETLYRARFAGFADKDAANNACTLVKKSGFGCFAIR